MRTFFSFLLVMILCEANSQEGSWRGQLRRSDGHNIVFNFEWTTEQLKPVWYINNSREKIRVPDVTIKNDSLIVQMPVFESTFRAVYRNNKIEGVWQKGSSSGIVSIPFTAIPGNERFPVKGSASQNITGKWSAVFVNEKGIADTAVAEVVQQGNQLTGTFLTASSDYRYLDGVVSNDALFLSTFDGSHAFLFTAKIDNDKKISGGRYYSGATYKENWSAYKNPKATVPYGETSMRLKPGQDHLDFKFNDLEGVPISINDDRFKNKVIVVQLMGSWCPNCMDETVFLSDYYNKNKQRGFEVVSLAYEYSTDIERSKKSLKKFQTAFNIKYPMLITGVALGDSLRTEKTLPQLTPIMVFPTSIFIDKKGKVRKLDTSFNGPGTGQHYEEYKREFEAMVDALLRES